MRLPIFSKRLKEKLISGKISIKLNSAIKQRILYKIEEFNDSISYTTDSGYNYHRSYTEDLETSLCHEHGWSSLKAFVKGKQGMQKVNIDEFIKNGAPQYVFDAIELYSNTLPDTYDFQREINHIFSDSQLNWRLSDGIIFQVESEYMAAVLASASQLLATTGFEGAKEEFQEARSHFDSGDYKGAIHHANLALESTMKSILGVEKERPGRLIRKMIDSGIIPSYYDKFLDNFEQVLRTVNVARNEEKGAGHGQGAEVVDVPTHLAELVVNFWGSLVVFLVNHHIDSKPHNEVQPEPEEEPSMVGDDNIPF
jgi:hypothetical protein